MKNNNFNITQQPRRRAIYGHRVSISCVELTLDRCLPPPWRIEGGRTGATRRNDATSRKLARMATHEGNSLIGGTFAKPPVERDMDMAEAGEASGAAGQRSEKTTYVSFMAASEQWERAKNGKRLRNEASEPVSAPGDRTSQMERTLSQQVREVTQLHHTIRRMARMLKAHAASDEAQWLGIKQWQEERDTKWNERLKANVLWGTGIADITVVVLGKARVCEAALAQEARKEGRDKTAIQDRGGLGASQYAGAMQDTEPEKCQLQQQPKPKPKLQLTLQPEPRQQPKPKPMPTPIPARRWETVQPRMTSQKSLAGPGTPQTTGSSMAERPNFNDKQVLSTPQ